ncbi:MAG: MFS transporter, partial [Planctomycetes bacterium]|nr:MFS transporter [Planctomycetota bacterium]
MTTPPLPLPPAAAPRGFGAHLQACAIGAGIDNLFRAVIGVALVGLAKQAHPGDSIAEHAAADRLGNLYTTLATLLFIIPFVIVAPMAGSLGDRLPKHRIIRITRLAEVALIAVGSAALALGSTTLLLASLVGLATSSAFFAPVKLAVVPELVSAERLPWANGWLAAITVFAILGGTALASLTDAGVLHALGLGWLGGAGMLALLGTVMVAIGIHGAWRIPPLHAQAPDTPIAPFWAIPRQMRALSSAPGLWAPALSLAGFWALGAVAQSTLLDISGFIYGLGQAGTAALSVTLACGIIAGALLAPRLMAKTFPAGLPVAGAVIAACALIGAGLHAQLGGGVVVFGALLFVTGFGSGLWETPLTVLLQERSPAGVRNLVMASAGVLASLAMIGGGGGSLVLSQVLHFSSSEVFIAIGAVALVITIVPAWRYRTQLAAWLVWVATHLTFRIRVTGAEHLPASGGCLLVCNHLSYSDGLVLGASLPRRARFLVYRAYVEMPVVGFFLRAAGVIPVSAEDRRRALLASIDTAIEAAKAGEVVVIFPEGQLTRSGQTNTFHSGMERIAARAGVPVVPAHLAGLWGTITSRAPQRSWPRLRRPVDLRLGAPLPSDTTAAVARDHVMRLGYEAAQVHADHDTRSLASAFLTRLRRHLRRIAVQDAGG